MSDKRKTPKKPSWYKEPKNKKSKENQFINKNENEFMREDEDSLTTYYNQLKGEPSTRVDVSNTYKKPTISDRINYNTQVNDNVDKLRNDCCKHIILNIYLNANPMDDDYKHKYYHKMSNDIDNMTASKGMSPAQYLTAAAEKTKSPVLEYFVWGIDKICQMYKEDAFAQYNDAIDKEIKITTPPAPDLTDGNINKHLIDMEDDPQAQDVLTAIENQTKSQIINNISNLLINKKQEKEMDFNPEPNDSLGLEESTISIGMDYISKYVMINESNTDIDDNLYDEFLGLCIRESTINEIDKCLGMGSRSIDEFKSSITFGNGPILNEMTIYELINK